MDKLKMHTPNLADENFKKLAAMFPNAVTETITGYEENGKPIIERAIDADVLRQEISAQVVEGAQERYQFTWPDKKKSVVLANAPIAKTLRLDREKSVGRDGEEGSIDSENIYIEGDNLDALKLLQETYLGKVKMIYILIRRIIQVLMLLSMMMTVLLAKKNFQRLVDREMKMEICSLICVPIMKQMVAFIRIG